MPNSTASETPAATALYRYGGAPSLLSAFLKFTKNDDAIGIRTFGHIVHAPAVGSLRELLVVNEDQHGFKTRTHTTG